MGVSGTTSPLMGVNGASVVTMGMVDDGGAAGASAGATAAELAAIKEARYSKVTARESLDSLKKRQKTAELQIHPPSVQPVLEQSEEQIDSTYASVTYDEIRSPGASGVVLSPL